MQDWLLVQLLLEALSKWKASLQKHGQFNNNDAYSWHVSPTNGNTVDLNDKGIKHTLDKIKLVNTLHVFVSYKKLQKDSLKRGKISKGSRVEGTSA